MEQVIDATLDREVESLSDAKVAAAYVKYKAVMGEEPPLDEDVTRDQISAAQNLLDNSLVPYCDFSVLGKARTQDPEEVEVPRAGAAG